jgi:hypothetical protein
MQAAHRIKTIERLYPDQWVVIEVTRASPSRGPLAGRVLAHSPAEDQITREAVKAREERPGTQLWTFYTGQPIPEGVIVILGCL